MVIESTIVCIDNGEFMRNGDFVPTRMQAQQEAAIMLMQFKLRSNAENNVALLTLAPKPHFQVGLTHDSGKLMAKLHQVQPLGFSQFSIGIQIAQLALKHRPNRNSQTRMVVFVGSPVEDTKDELTKLAKQLKKSNYQVDMVSFGEEGANQEKLQSFIETLNGTDDKSHLVVVPSGSNLQEALLQSPILRGDGGDAAPMAMGAGGGFDFGVDAAEDPELALALRVSLEEERLRLQQQAQREGVVAAGPTEAAGADGAATSSSLPNPSAVAASSRAASSMPVNFEAMTDDEQMEYALRISMAQENAPAAPSAVQASAPSRPPVTEPMDVVEDSDKKPGTSITATGLETDPTVDQIISDPEALEQLLSTLPGVNPKSEAFRKAKEEKERDDNMH